MTDASPDDDADWVAPVARLVGDRWSILTVRALFRGIRRFDDLQAELGISRGVLSDRLKRLTEAGVVEKVLYQERPPRYDYRLTPLGIDLSPTVVALLRWGSRWAGVEEPATQLVHKPCGTPFEQAFWCNTCRTTFGPLGVGARHS